MSVIALINMKKYIKVYLSICAVGVALVCLGQDGTLLMNGRVHTGNGKLIENGAVGFKGGIITFVGPSDSAPKSEYKNVMNAENKDIYPGLIASNTTLGLNEIFAVRASHDYREVGAMNPNIRSIIAYNAESKITETVISNGVLMAQICPRGARISGTSSVVKLHGWNWEDAVYSMDEGLHMDWPGMFKRKGERSDPIAFEPDDDYEIELLKLKNYFKSAEAYSNRENHLEVNLEFEAMRGVFSGEKRLYIKSDFIKEIREIISFKRNYDIKKLTIVGGYDSWMVADLLRENDISILVRRVNSLPRFSEDLIDAPFSLPSKLADEEVKFSFQMAGDMETMQNRNLPFNIGSAIAYGLDPELALQAATLHAAEILGIDQTTGSLEIGKDANVIVSAGDLFDMRTSLIEQAYIEGELLDLQTNQDNLYLKYKGKYGLEN